LSLLRKLFGHSFDRVEEPRPLLRALGEGRPDPFGVRTAPARPPYLSGRSDPQAMADLKAILTIHGSPPEPRKTPVSISDPQVLGQKIREYRLSRKLSQAQLAEEARVGTRFVGELERGKPTLELGKVIHVVTACGLALVLE
jgi:HTH-type transcriptional regulator / antitoxin HipB